MACDELGVLLIQDMPSMPANRLPNADQQKEWERQLYILIEQHKNYPSIYTWVSPPLPLHSEHEGLGLTIA